MVGQGKRQIKSEANMFCPKQLEGWSCPYQDGTDVGWVWGGKKGKEEFGLGCVHLKCLLGIQVVCQVGS